MLLPDLIDSDIELLELSIDKMNETLPALRSFVLPAGNIEIAQCHVARCVCRRAERQIVQLDELENVEPEILKYTNRLSDYLFVLGRYVGFLKNIPEVSWKPRM